MLKHAKKLEEMGVPKEQAEAQIQIIADIMEENLATKLDVQELKYEIASVKSDLSALENRLLIKIGTMMGVLLTLAVSMLSLINSHK